MKERLFLKIADTTVVLESDFPRIKSDKGIAKERFHNFFCFPDKNPDIKIKVYVVRDFPKISRQKISFYSIHPQDNSLCWEWGKLKDRFIFRSLVEEKKQFAFIDSDFKNVKFFMLAKKDKFSWMATDVIYDFLQILFLVYFAKTNRGIFLHACAIKLNNEGFVFVGKSGTGKTTLAKLWNKYTSTEILNDDRIIVRKFGKEFYIYGCPWHGAFSDYLKGKMSPAKLKRIFFIHHSAKNTLKKLDFSDAFKLMYPAIFPVFWDRRSLKNTLFFLKNLLRKVECFSLGFRKTKEIIYFFKEKCAK